ncbi:MAG: type II secretion system F family protein [Gaiellales bacterium]
MRRLSLTLIALLCLAALPAQGAAASTTTADRHIGLTIEPDARFPQRKFVVTLPPGADPTQLQVTENGVPVILHLKPITSERLPLSIALVLDTSDSMRGEKLAAAMSAAQTLIDAKPLRAEVAVFGFAKQPVLLGGWSQDARSFSPALSNLTTTHGTAIWDSVVMASQLLSERGGTSKALILLTDGQDVSSRGTAGEAAAAARAAHVRVYAVTVGTSATDRQQLQQLVDATGGEFIQVASSTELQHVYAGLAARLAQEYTLTYTSQMASGGEVVSVRATLNGVSAEQRYSAPTGRPLPPPASGHGPMFGTIPTILIALAVAFVVLLSALLVLRPRGPSAARRLRAYGIHDEIPGIVADSIVLPERPRAPRGGAPWRLWDRFTRDVDRGQIGHSPGQVMGVGIAGGMVAALLTAAATGRPETAIVIAPLGPIVAWWHVSRQASHWYAHFDATLADSLAVMASSLRVGQSLLQSVAHVAAEADERTAHEWHQVVRDTRLGMPVEDALDRMVARVGNRDLHWIALVARVQHQAGGNMAEMFDTVADTVRQRHRLRAQVMTLTAQGRMSRWVLTLAPVALGGVFFLLSPSYVSLLIDDPYGRVAIGVAAGLTVVGSFWLKRIVEIEV